jgi:mRNA-degrading endonuclease RelE of RelBE toxin-antitoxin system
MKWRLEIPPGVKKELDALPDRVWLEAMEMIAAIDEDPFLSGAEALRGHTDVYRIYFYRNRYRVVYLVSKKQYRIVLWRVRPRGTAYIGLE